MPRSARKSDTPAKRRRAKAAGSSVGATAKPGQRERLIEAMTVLCAKHGYQAVSVAQVSAQAGVSSATFYEQFNDKEDCLLAAYREAAAQVLDQMRPVPAHQDWSDAGEWSEEANAALARLLWAVERAPDMARVLFTAALAAGPRLTEERRHVLEEFERRAQDFLDSPPEQVGVLDIPSVALVGALRSIVSRRLRTYAEQELPGLAEDLTAWLVAYARPAGQTRWSTSSQSSLKRAAKRAPPADQVPVRIPRGRHRLPAGVVARSRRIRIIHATAEVTLAKGYADATVSDIVTAAGIAREVFYEHFTDKQHAFLEAQQHSTQEILDACATAFFSVKDWPERVWLGMDTLISVIVANPALAHLRLVECYAVGPPAIRRAEEITRAFTVFLEEGYGYRPQACELPRITSQAIAGAIFEVVQRDIAQADPDRLARRLPQLAYIAIAPFTGADQAIALIEEIGARAAHVTPVAS